MSSNILQLVNRLNQSRNPYLRKYEKSSVAWQLWDAEALALAKAHNRMILLNIGFEACTLCDTMELECFQKRQVYTLLNKECIPIKIDREERPDLDAIYQIFAKHNAGIRGHPLNVFMTPEMLPLIAGKYSPASRMNRTDEDWTDENFVRNLKNWTTMWSNSRAECKVKAEAKLKDFGRLTEAVAYGHEIEDDKKGPIDDEVVHLQLLEVACNKFEQLHLDDSFSDPPFQNFLHPETISFLLRLNRWPFPVQDAVGTNQSRDARKIALEMLRRLARNRLKDHETNHAHCGLINTLSGVDSHLSSGKMLQDQAQYLSLYIEASLATEEQVFADSIDCISTYMCEAPICNPGIGFFSAEFAKSWPKETLSCKSEATLHVWASHEISTILDRQQAGVKSACLHTIPQDNMSPENTPEYTYSVRRNDLPLASKFAKIATKNHTNQSLLSTLISSASRNLKGQMSSHRSLRSLDDKVVVSWNGLAISALARSAALCHFLAPHKSRAYLNAARSALFFILKHLFQFPTRSLYRLWSDYNNKSEPTKALCSDYAFLIAGLIDLYEATFDDFYLLIANALQQTQIQQFWDADTGGFFISSSSAPDVLLRLKSGLDGQEPSSNNISASNLFRLGSMLDFEGFTRKAEQTVLAFKKELTQYPHKFPGLLQNMILFRLGVRSVILTGETIDPEMLQNLRARAKLGQTVVRIGGGNGDWLRERNGLLRNMRPEETAVYVHDRGSRRKGGEELLNWDSRDYKDETEEVEEVVELEEEEEEDEEEEEEEEED